MRGSMQAFVGFDGWRRLVEGIGRGRAGGEVAFDRWPVIGLAAREGGGATFGRATLERATFAMGSGPVSRAKTGTLPGGMASPVRPASSAAEAVDARAGASNPARAEGR